MYHPGNFWGKDESNKEVNFLPFYKMYNTVIQCISTTIPLKNGKNVRNTKQQEEEMELSVWMFDGGLFEPMNNNRIDLQF